MVVIGIDAHKRTHTAVLVDANGRPLASRTCGSTSKDHLALLRWAAGHDKQRIWAVEDCRNMTRRLERDLLAAGERIVRVPPKLMANMRDSARTYGKSDPIDALAVARAALREDNLPVAHLDGPDRDLRLLVDHREDLLAERTRAVNRLRWHLHELDADWDPPARSLDRASNLNRISARLAKLSGTVARLATAITERCRQLTVEIDALHAHHLIRPHQAAPGSATASTVSRESAGAARSGRRRLAAYLYRSLLADGRSLMTSPLPMLRPGVTGARLAGRGCRLPRRRRRCGGSHSGIFGGVECGHDDLSCRRAPTIRRGAATVTFLGHGHDQKRPIRKILCAS